MFNKPTLSAPNELGFQFGLNKDLTEYANKEQLQCGGSSLPALKGWKVLEVWKNDERITYLLIDDKGNGMGENGGYEAMACKIDAYKLIEQHNQINAEDNE